jgi:predicted nucleic acid-binding protein
MTTKNEKVRVYWDSCVYIDCIQKTQPRFSVLEKIYEQAEIGEIEFIASTFILAEVVKCKNLAISAADQEAVIRRFFKKSFFRFRPVDRQIAEKAAAISRTFPDIKPPDAIHIATAIRYECRCFQTYDGECGGPKKPIAYSGRIDNLTIELPRVILFDRQQTFDSHPPPPPAIPPPHSNNWHFPTSRKPPHPLRRLIALSPPSGKLCNR